MGAAMAPLAHGDRSPHGRPACAIISFGFGGKVVLMYPRARMTLGGVPNDSADAGPLRKGPIEICGMQRLVPLASLIPSASGPAADLSDDALAGQLQERLCGLAEGSPERLWWQLLDVARTFKGQLRSEKPPSDADSPEHAIVDALLKHAPSTTELHAQQAAPDPPPSPDTIAQIESLLVHGHREQALELAVSARLWGMALVISSIIDRERYQAVVRQYADACLAAGSPAHTLSLIFSGQAAGAIQHQGRALLAPLAATSHAPVAAPAAASVPPLLRHWQTNLAAIIANRTPGWEKLVTDLGDRIVTECTDPFAAHIAYLLAGLGLDEAPSPSARLCLIGWNHRAARQLPSSARIAAIQRSELLERIVPSCALEAGAAAAAAGGGAGAAGSAGAAGGELTLCASLQRHKLWYATVLAEAGCGEHAVSYVRSVRATVAAASRTAKQAAAANTRKGAGAPKPSAAESQLVSEIDVIEVRYCFPFLSFRESRC
jgi:hypothetical protein